MRPERWRELVGHGPPRSAEAEPQPAFERELRELAVDLARLGQPHFAPGPMLALESRRMAGGAEAWSRYAHGDKVQLAEGEVRALEERLAQLAPVPGLGPAAALGNPSRHRLREVLDEAGMSAEKAAVLLLEDLRASMVAASAERRDRRGTALKAPEWARSAGSALTKNVLSAVFADMPTTHALLAKPALGGDGADLAFAGKRIGSAAGSELDGFAGWGKEGDLDRAALAGAGEAKEAVRLIERLLDMARRYSVDLVAILEHYGETARRMVREAQAVQSRRQLRDDQQAIERTLAALDPRQLAQDLAALPLYLHQLDSDAGAVGTALLPRLGNKTLEQSYTRLCQHLLQLPAIAAAPAAPPAAPAAPADIGGQKTTTEQT